MANLGHQIDKLTVRNILRRHHMDPAPQRRKGGMGWAQFLKLHWEVLAATDFFTVEVATWHGLVTYYVLVVMELATRRVHIAGITPHPTAAFMQQCARQLTDPFEGFLVGKRYLHPRPGHEVYAGIRRAPQGQRCGANRLTATESQSQRPLRTICAFHQGGGPCIRWSCWENAHCMYAIQQYLTHYHHERNHQGLDNQLIAPEPGNGDHSGQVCAEIVSVGCCATIIERRRDSALFFNHTASGLGVFSGTVGVHHGGLQCAGSVAWVPAPCVELRAPLDG